MHTEIERKFLVLDNSWRKLAKATEFWQGYIYSDSKCLVRIRMEGEQAFLTLKGPKQGIARAEFEYAIPSMDGIELLKQLAFKPLTHKIRHTLYVGEHLWEIDEFCDENAGLIVAEIELASETELFQKPTWLGKEVTFDARYRHASLAKFPYNMWTNEQKQGC